MSKSLPKRDPVTGIVPEGETGTPVMWIDVRSSHQAIIVRMMATIEALPSAQSSGLSRTTRGMLIKMDEALLGTKAWFGQAKNFMSNDMDDIKSVPWLVTDGHHHVICLRELYTQADATRKEYLLLKACTTLSSAPDRKEQMKNLNKVLIVLKELVGELQKTLKALEPVFTPEVMPSGAEDEIKSIINHTLRVSPCADRDIVEHTEERLRTRGELLFREARGLVIDGDSVALTSREILRKRLRYAARPGDPLF